MCVIIVKIKGSDFAPQDAIEACFRHNPDGFSFAWNKDGQLNIFKTMDIDEALAKYKELSSTLNPAETSMVIHARIKSHGSIKIENCHCWEHNGLAFAHNGILSNIPNRDDMTDSETFFRDYFVPAWDNISFDYALKLARAVIGSSNNKFAMINANGELFLTGGDTPHTNFTKLSFDGRRGKIYFSNTYWMPRSHYNSALGFNPYADVKPAKKPVASNGPKAAGTSGTPLVGPRRSASPAKPLAITRGKEYSGLSYQELYDQLPFR